MGAPDAIKMAGALNTAPLDAMSASGINQTALLALPATSNTVESARVHAQSTLSKMISLGNAPFAPPIARPAIP